MSKVYKNGMTPCVICKKKYLISDPCSYEFNDDKSICKKCVLKVLNNTAWGIERTPKIVYEYVKVSIPSNIRAKVFKKDNFMCVYCKSTKNLSVDHIFPESLGGELKINNLQTLCRSCNSKKKDTI